MSDETALLRAIAAHPDEDTPRLIYADFVEERGRPERAAFVRGQIELAQLTDDSPHRREIAYQCRRLLDAHEQQWLDPPEAFERDWGWSRGFVETFSTTPADLSYGHDGIFRTHPFRRVWVWKLNGDVEGLHLIPNDNHITALDLTGNDLNVNQLKKLAKMTHFPHLRELGLAFNGLRDPAAKVLCGEPFFQRLELIDLGANSFTNRGSDQISSHFRRRVAPYCDRGSQHLYTIREDYLCAGWGHEFTQLLIASEPQEQWLAVFDHAGNLIRTERRAVEHDLLGKGVSRAAMRDAWLQELGHTPATVRVKKFRLPNWIGIRDFPPPRELHDYPAWLEEGRFQLDLNGTTLRLNRNGTAVD